MKNKIIKRKLHVPVFLALCTLFCLIMLSCGKIDSQNTTEKAYGEESGEKKELSKDARKKSLDDAGIRTDFEKTSIIGTDNAGKNPKSKKDITNDSSLRDNAEMDKVRESNTDDDGTKDSTSQNEGDAAEDVQPQNINVILSYEAISNLNREWKNTPGTGLRDLETVGTTVDYSFVYSLIDKYRINGNYLVNGAPISAPYIDSLYASRNINNIQEHTGVQYAVFTENTALRSFPSDDFVTDADGKFDYLQLTRERIGSFAAVLHYTNDYSWCFVLCGDYFGWCHTYSLANLGYEEFLQYQNRMRDISGIVTILSDVDYGNRHICMGTRFLLDLEKSNKSQKYILIPESDVNGHAVYKSVNLDFTGDYCSGVLPFSYENLFSQEDKLIDMPYSWGDKNYGYDCSSLVGALFSCFGFDMPRDTDNMLCMTGNFTDVTSLSTDQRYSFLYNLQPGSLLFFPGHVMIYRGPDENGNLMILHDMSTFKNDNLESVPVYSTKITSVMIRRGNGASYLDSFDKIYSWSTQ